MSRKWLQGAWEESKYWEHFESKLQSTCEPRQCCHSSWQLRHEGLNCYFTSLQLTYPNQPIKWRKQFQLTRNEYFNSMGRAGSSIHTDQTALWRSCISSREDTPAKLDICKRTLPLSSPRMLAFHPLSECTFYTLWQQRANKTIAGGIKLTCSVRQHAVSIKATCLIYETVRALLILCNIKVYLIRNLGYWQRCGLECRDR